MSGIENMEELTPAQQYRLALSKLSDHEKLIMRLENRWKKNVDKWIRASIRVQAVYRGYRGKRVAMGLRGKARVLKMKLDLVAKAQEAFRWKKWEELMNSSAEVLKMDPEHVEVRRLRGHCHLGQKQYREAIEEYSEALLRDKNHIECRTARVRCLSILREYSSAFEDFNHLMEIDSENSSYWHLRGLIHGKLNMWPQAAADFEQCVELGDSEPSDYIRRGMAQASSQRWEDAIASFGEALRRDERNVMALYMRGRVYCCYRKWAEAEEDFNMALRWDPRCEEAQRGLEIIAIPHLPLPLTDGVEDPSGTVRASIISAERPPSKDEQPDGAPMGT